MHKCEDGGWERLPGARSPELCVCTQPRLSVRSGMPPLPFRIRSPFHVITCDSTISLLEHSSSLCCRQREKCPV